MKPSRHLARGSSIGMGCVGKSGIRSANERRVTSQGRCARHRSSYVAAPRANHLPQAPRIVTVRLSPVCSPPPTTPKETAAPEEAATPEATMAPPGLGRRRSRGQSGSGDPSNTQKLCSDVTQSVGHDQNHDGHASDQERSDPCTSISYHGGHLLPATEGLQTSSPLSR